MKERRADTSWYLTVNAAGQLCYAEVPIRGVHKMAGPRYSLADELVFTLA